MATQRLQSSWFTYGVPIILGLAFTLTLLFVTWNNTINSNTREFQLATNGITGSMARNVQNANDTLISLSSFLQINPELIGSQFNSLASSLIRLHSFMEGVVLITQSTENSNGSSIYDIKHQFLREGSLVNLEPELANNRMNEILSDDVLKTNSVIALPSELDIDGWKGFWILRRVDFEDVRQTNSGSAVFVAILINTSKLGVNIPENVEISLLLLSDYASLSGRQLLHQNQIDNVSLSYVDTLLEENTTQFPYYSLRLSISKYLLWSEVEKTTFLIVLMIGSGMTLLLVALVKTREEQAKQLRERNIIIEGQVREQTIELAEARDKALDASKMKSSFLASMSHEIRTPLNAIIGMSDLMIETKLNQEQKKYVSVFKKAGDTLLSLVNDILDLSKIEADQLHLEEIEFNLVETIEESVEIYGLKAADKRIELVCHIEPSVSPFRTGDPSRLRQVILNLISNALKFTDEGEIYISVVKLNDETEDEFKISVIDTGTGIPQNKLEAIFESFSQADSSTTRKYGGTGLGLTISRRLIEMMGGKIWVESVEGEGSCFSVELSLPVTENTNPHYFARKESEKNVLVLDDNQHSRDAMGSYISNLGYRVRKTGSGDKAMEYLDGDINIDIIIIDADLSGQDGFDYVEKIRQKNINVPIIMLLNPAALNLSQPKLEKFKISSMYLTKPVRRNELYNLIDKINIDNNEQGIIPNKKKETLEDIKPLRILLVDDNPDNRLLVKAYLKKMPYDIVEAENGEEACNLFVEYGFDLVLMDVQMPVMDGREATRKIREHEKNVTKTHTAIIALTAHAIKEEVDLCLEAGCDSHLSKPVKKATLVTTIQSMTN